MADIKFVPICSSCGTMVSSIVESSKPIEDDGWTITVRDFHAMMRKGWDPKKLECTCPTCKQVFERIVMPEY